MIIVGWIRLGDKSTCGGVVAEASAHEHSDGIGYSFRGARMSCSGDCTIADGYPQSILSNGAAQVIDGQKTSRGCRLLSTLNGVDGVAEN